VGVSLPATGSQIYREYMPSLDVFVFLFMLTQLSSQKALTL
jgi:hypothetical protein